MNRWKPDITFEDEILQTVPDLIVHILKVETWTVNGKVVRVKKTSSGKKRINSNEMDKWKKHNLSWLHVDPIADIILGQDVTATYKVTTDEEGLNIDTAMSGTFKLVVQNETNSDKALLLNVVVTAGKGSLTIQGAKIKEVGKYSFNNGHLKQTQMNGEVSFNVTTN